MKSQLLAKTNQIETQKTIFAIEKETAIKAAVEENGSTTEALQLQLTSAVEIANALQRKVENLSAQLQKDNLEYQNELEQTELQYKAQIKQLESRLATIESKNYELLSSSQSSTEPLLLQISQLESQLKISRTDWKHMESSLLMRSQAAEKENGQLTNKLKELESENIKMVS